MRDEPEASFSRCFDIASQTAAGVGVEPSRPRIAGRQRHRGNIPAESTEEHFRKNLAIPFLDHILVELKAKFSGIKHVKVFEIELYSM